ncbi:hypothetical protein [Flavobacterium sp. GCM10023249]|uniref:hypothetical protein n=1 Tax=unclassified Flavobacterium TaxID=196869 RepID=UPI00360D33F3
MPKKKKRNFILIVMLVCTNFIFAQNYLLPNEQLIYSFETQNGKKMVLAKDQNHKYIIYRFGTKSKVDFEFPDKTKESWNKFTYSFYLRGGGKQNEGMDLNYVTFTNENFKYVIYNTYYAVENHTLIGIKVTDLIEKKTIDIKGKKNTRKGSLVDFRFDKLLKIEDQLEE